MTLITVSQFGRHDTPSDEFERSSCLATDEFIERYHLVAIEGTRIQIDESLVKGGVTEKGFC